MCSSDHCLGDIRPSAVTWQATGMLSGGWVKVTVLGTGRRSHHRTSVRHVESQPRNKDGLEVTEQPKINRERHKMISLLQGSDTKSHPSDTSASMWPLMKTQRVIILVFVSQVRPRWCSRNMKTSLRAYQWSKHPQCTTEKLLLLLSIIKTSLC